MERQPTHSDPTTRPWSGDARTDVDPEREIRAVTRQVLGRLSPILLLLGGLAAVVGIVRTLEFGWQPLIAVYVALVLALAAVVRWQRRLPVASVALLLAGIGIVDGVLALLFYGFASSGLLLLSAAVVLVSVFVGTRAGLLLCGLLALTLVVIAGLVCTGTLGIDIDIDIAEYAESPRGWTVQIVHFVFLTSLLSTLISTIQERLKAAIGSVQQRTDELAGTNRSLEAEIAARTQAEQTLRQREARYRLLTHHMHEVLLQQDLDHRVVYVSPSVERMFGYSVDEALKLSVAQVLVPESLRRFLERHRGAIERASVGRASAPLLELECVRKDGTTFWGELASDYLTGEDGALVGSVSVLRDITERRRIQGEQERMSERLRQAEKLQVLGQLAGGIAHDFNNQLAGILGYAELLKNQCKENDLVQEATQVILHCGRRSRELTTKLLAFARREPEQTLTVSMHEIVREVEAILARSIGKNVALVLDLEAPQALVVGDPSQLQNALLNLAVNARDAMPDGGTLTISSRVIRGLDARRAGAAELDDDSEYLVIEVRDTGEGIADEVLPRIFEPFFTTKAVGQGTGIGLPAVQGTALAHHGAVTVRSQLAEGSTFGLYLPLARGPEHAPDELGPRSTSGSGRILIVDDEPNVRGVLQLALTDLGYAVDVAVDGAEALERFRSGRNYDVVLLDMIMPGMSGTAVFHALKAIRPDTKVVLMSGYSEDGAAWKLLRSGALRLIPKPFSLSELSAEVAKAVRAKPAGN